MRNDSFRESPWPPLRNALLTALSLHRPHTVYGTGEIDVTETLLSIRKCQRESGIAVSFHAFILSCVARAAAQHPQIHRYRFRRKFIAFDDIDIGTVVEKRLPHGRLPVQHIFRSADKKTFAQINWELRQTSRSDPTLDPNVRMRRRVARLPGFVRRIVAWKIRRNPFWLKNFHGTIGVTNVQRQDFHNPFFALPPNFFTATLAVGSITDRFLPDAEGRPVLRRMLCLGMGADHVAIDGGDIARFCETLANLVTTGAGLDAAFVEESRRLRRESKR